MSGIVAESKEDRSLKPRTSKGLRSALLILTLCALPSSTRAYTDPYVQPQKEEKLQPGVKKPELIPIKQTTGHVTGYFGPKKEDYKSRAKYHEAVAMNGAGDKTKSGTKPHIGTIAADLRVYPIGTMIFIPEMKFLGKVEDTGSKIKGARHIDIFCGHGKGAEKIAKNLGKKPVTLVVMQEEA